MKPNPTEEFLIGLLSKRKQAFHRGVPVLSWLDIDSNERKQLYEIAKKRRLLTEYQFSGVKAYGVNRNDAARFLLDQTRNRALEKLKVAFGSRAHFWVRPKRLSYVDIDFYWRVAKFGVVIMGPLMDDPYRGDPVRVREPSPSSAQAVAHPLRKGLNGLTIHSVPYYEVWHHPSSFLEQVRSRLVLSGHYPKLVCDASD